MPRLQQGDPDDQDVLLPRLCLPGVEVSTRTDLREGDEAETGEAEAVAVNEDAEQIALFEWARLAQGTHPELALLLHIPNGGSRHKLEAVKLKRLGVRPGVPDLFLPVPRHGLSGLWIEMKREALRPKTPKGRGGVSDEQGWWLKELWKRGYQASVAWGFEEAREIIERYLA